MRYFRIEFEFRADSFSGKSGNGNPEIIKKHSVCGILRLEMIMGTRRSFPLTTALFLISLTIVYSETSDLMKTLSNGNEFPLLGLGVGNMEHGKIVGAVADAVSMHGMRLVDTAAASRNEHLVDKG